jgi:hypothetical protein
MGKFYEDLDTLNELIKKVDKKNQLAEFIIRVVSGSKFLAAIVLPRPEEPIIATIIAGCLSFFISSDIISKV